jgi:hypothetical protein
VEPPAWNDFHTALPTNTGVWSRGVTVTDPSSRIVYSVVTHSLGLRSPTFRPRLLTRIPPRPAPAPPEALGVFPMPAYGGIDIQAISGTVIDMAAPVIVDGKPT